MSKADKKTVSVKNLSLAGLFCALIYVTTMISVPVGTGYIHVGDSFIYISSCILPFPLCSLSAAVGGALSDLTLGYAVYAIPTFIVKLLNSVCIHLVCSKSKSLVRDLSGVILSGLVTVIGYYLVAVILYGGFKAQLYTIPGNIIQAVASGVIFILLKNVIIKKLR